MDIRIVNDKKTKEKFLDVARLIYKSDPVWVCPLDRQLNDVFNPDVNTYFNHGTACRWVLFNDQGLPIGRIAAFIDDRSCNKSEQPTGGIGFFECINDRGAAHVLFDTAKKWLTELGMEAMDGPINFGETDSFWGLLVSGFTHPSYEIAYNPPYYQDLFESYGFQTYYKQEGFHLDVTKPLPERFQKIAERVAKNKDYSFEHFTWKNKEKYSSDFVDVYNVAWASFKENFEPMKVEYIAKTLKKARSIIDEEFIWLAYHRGKPIAIYLMYPDVNMILKKLNGKLNFFNMLKFLYYKRKKTITRARGVLMGVIPEFQNKGIEAAIVLNLVKVFEKKRHYSEIEFSWVGDFNPKMRKIFIAVGSKSVKHYITYRYLFDRTKPFKRFPIPEMN